MISPLGRAATLAGGRWTTPANRGFAPMARPPESTSSRRPARDSRRVGVIPDRATQAQRAAPVKPSAPLSRQREPERSGRAVGRLMNGTAPVTSLHCPTLDDGRPPGVFVRCACPRPRGRRPRCARSP